MLLYIYIYIMLHIIFYVCVCIYIHIYIMLYIVCINVGLKLNIQNTKIMTSGPITLWQIDGETRETVTEFVFLDSKITADDNCSRELKRCLLMEEKL